MFDPRRFDLMPWVWATAAALGCAACGAGADTATRAGGFGVDTVPSGRIVARNPAEGVWEPGLEWSLEPVVRIGSAGGAPAYEFGHVLDVAIGPDENVYVLDYLAQEIRVFDLRGTLVGGVGRPGAGLGELRGAYALAFDGSGRLWVAESGNRRYSVFSTSLEPIAAYRSPIRGGEAAGRIRFDARGRLLDWRSPDHAVALAFDDSVGAVVVDSVVLRSWVSAGFVRTLGTEQLVDSPPFSPMRHTELSRDGGVWVGVSDEYALHQLSTAGDTVRTITRAADPEPLTGEDVDRLRQWATDARAVGYEGDDRLLPAAYPHFDGLVEADDGALWVYRATSNSARFDVFDPSGVFLGTVPTTLDPGLTGVSPHITGRHLAAVGTDSLGAEFVEVYRIVKPGGDRPSP